jgi:hypothetical protein
MSMYGQAKFPCPCCGYLVFDYQPGFHQVCPICGWEDDLSQLRFPLMPGGANSVSLEDAQRNYCEFGASARRKRDRIRAPLDDEELDKGWRLLDTAVDNVEEPSRGNSYGNSYPWPDTTVLYYWRTTYWRRLVG